MSQQAVKLHQEAFAKEFPLKKEFKENAGLL
jgi:hypothetical protein